MVNIKKCPVCGSTRSKLDGEYQRCNVYTCRGCGCTWRSSISHAILKDSKKTIKMDGDIPLERCTCGSKSLKLERVNTLIPKKKGKKKVLETVATFRLTCKWCGRCVDRHGFDFAYTPEDVIDSWNRATYDHRKKALLELQCVRRNHDWMWETDPKTGKRYVYVEECNILESKHKRHFVSRSKWWRMETNAEE